MKKFFQLKNHNNYGEFQIMLTLALLRAIALINQGLVLAFLKFYMTLFIPVTMICMYLPL
jgi:hypothetical protein